MAEPSTAPLSERARLVAVVLGGVVGIVVVLVAVGDMGVGQIVLTLLPMVVLLVVGLAASAWLRRRNDPGRDQPQ